MAPPWRCPHALLAAYAVCCRVAADVFFFRLMFLHVRRPAGCFHKARAGWRDGVAAASRAFPISAAQPARLVTGVAR